MENGSLFDLLHGDNSPLVFNHFDRLRMARQTSMGLAFLHANKILHRDVKSLNILVNKNRICKLADFGSAKLIRLDTLEFYTADVGTPLWMAPEVRNGNPYNLSADIYSLGVVLYEIFENKLPDYDREQMMIVIRSFNFPSGKLIKPMLNLNPKDRPSAESITKQLNKVLHYVIEKGKTVIDFDSLMTQNCHPEQEVNSASKLVDEALWKYSKEFSSLHLSAVPYDDDDDHIVIVNNFEEDDDDEEDEFQDHEERTEQKVLEPYPKAHSAPLVSNKDKENSRRVLSTFQSQNAGEISVLANDLIDVVKVKGDRVKCVTRDKRSGWVPSIVVELHDPNPL